MFSVFSFTLPVVSGSFVSAVFPSLPFCLPVFSVGSSVCLMPLKSQDCFYGPVQVDVHVPCHCFYD